MYRAYISGLLATTIGLVGVSEAIGQPECRPVLAIKEVHFSEMQPTTLERKWTAIVSVDVSHCAGNPKGYFDIGFERLKEVGRDVAFLQRFDWQSPLVKVEVDFAADEAVQTYWIHDVAACPCPK